MGKPTFDDLYCDGVERSALLHYRLSVKVLNSEYIGVQGEPGELKHLSTRRKGHQRDSVSSGERTRIRPVPVLSLPERPGMAGALGDSPVRDGRTTGLV
jgi:hypothetical protein